MATKEKLGRNSPCECGSGKKYKQCCLGKEVVETAQKRKSGALIVFCLVAIVAVLLWIFKGYDFGLAGLGAAFIAAGATYVLRDPNPPRGGSGSDSSAINFGN